MIPRLDLRIGTKMAISAGVGVLLVAGMVANQQLGAIAIGTFNALAFMQQETAADALAGSLSAARAQIAIRDLLMTATAETTETAVKATQSSAAEGQAHAAAAANRALDAEQKERFVKAKSLIGDYAAAAGQMAAVKRKVIENREKRAKLLQDLSKALDAALTSPALRNAANRREVEADIRLADSEYKDARIASWRFSSTLEAPMIDRVGNSTAKALEILQRARGATDDQAVVATIDEFIRVIKALTDTMTAVMNGEQEIDEIRANRAAPVRVEFDALLAKATETSVMHANRRKAEAAADIVSVGRRGLLVGAFVMILLIGSAVFSLVGIARPIRRIGQVLRDLANGNKAVEVPHTDRGDEIGEAAKAALAFRDNLVRIEAMEAEQKQIEARAATERKAEMSALANSFEAAVGNIVDAVSSTATELEAAASTLTHTAETTEQRAAVVAGASEEASSNVQSVASATDEMTSSVHEIGRQVQHSSEIANEAVRQAEKTDARIAELSHAAQRIGDVVKLITAIAEQTNLLALNATIEAARAGEAGRGFAVVAQEVKALAAQTAKATDEIGTQIASMQTATQDSVGAIKEIGGTINRISEISSAIAAAVEEQGAATQEIARNVQQAAQGTTDVASNIGEVNRGAAETGSASAQVFSSAQALAGEGNRLKLEVRKFLDTVRAA